MSDEPTLHITVPGGEWWYYASLILNNWPSTGGTQAITMQPVANGYRLSFEALVGSAVITGTDNETTIVIRPTAAAEKQWLQLLGKIQRIAGSASMFRRRAISRTLREVLDEYYARLARGERVKLIDMAAEAGVKYNSLRQAKVRYDAARRKMLAAIHNASGDTQK
jgi:hypothetical protein